MGRLEGEIVVRKSRREVYSYLMELQTRASFMPEEFHNFRLTSVNPFGVGATLAFDLQGGAAEKGHFVLSGVLPPQGITELGRVGELRWTLRYALDERDDGTTVRVIMEYSVASFLKKPLERLLYAPRARKWHTAILERLRRTLDSETSADTAARTTRQQSGYVGAQRQPTTEPAA